MYDYIIYIYIIVLAFQHNGDVSLENYSRVCVSSKL